MDTNVLPDPPVRGRSRLGRTMDIMLGKVVTLVLAAVALLLAIGTFVLLSGGAPITLRPNATFVAILASAGVLLLLCAVVAGRLTRVWVERRRGSAGSRLHVRLVLMFGVVSVTPSIVVAVFAAAFFNLGIQSWFDDRIRTALDASLTSAQSSLEEHRNNIKADALGVAITLNRAGAFLSSRPQLFQQVLDQETSIHGLIQAVIYDPLTHEIIVSSGVLSGNFVELPSDEEIEPARRGDVAVIGGGNENHVRAVVKLGSTPELMLMIDRPVDTQIIAAAERTERLVAEYHRLDENRSKLQVTFAVIFALVALLVLFAAVLTGLVLANQIARPVGRLIHAAERVRAGDLSVRVPEIRSEDEVAGLSRAFNRMTGQLSAQRSELMEAYAQIDERRRFTETVLAGVSAGVIGLDGEARVDLPNRAASELMNTDLLSAIGLPLDHVVPEFAPLLHEVQAAPDRARTAEVQVGPPANRRTLILRIGTEMKGAGIEGYVVTFDDVTELLAAQRKAAWSDVARRIAHEIKNPADPDPAFRRATEAAFHQGDPVRPGHLRAVRRHHRAPCRRHRPHGGRVQRLRAHAAAGDQAGGHRPHRPRVAGAAAPGASGDRLDYPSAGPRPAGRVRPPPGQPGAHQPLDERRRRGGHAGARRGRGQGCDRRGRALRGRHRHPAGQR